MIKSNDICGIHKNILGIVPGNYVQLRAYLGEELVCKVNLVAAKVGGNYDREHYKLWLTDDERMCTVDSRAVTMCLLEVGRVSQTHIELELI